MESIVLIVIGVVALGVILYMTISESSPGCHKNDGNCSSCSLYRSCDQYPGEDEGKPEE